MSRKAIFITNGLEYSDYHIYGIVIGEDLGDFEDLDRF